jgi:hypothetical protein
MSQFQNDIIIFFIKYKKNIIFDSIFRVRVRFDNYELDRGEEATDILKFLKIFILIFFKFTSSNLSSSF